MSDLVNQVKALQRSCPAAKQTWWDYCDANLGGIRDPGKHDENVLQAFLSSYNSGSLPTSTVTAATQGSNAGLNEFIKTGQRHSQVFKTAWENYCTQHGNPKFDPTIYDQKFITGFIDWVGRSATGMGGMMQMGGFGMPNMYGMPTMNMMQGGMKRRMDGSFQATPSSKRQAPSKVGGGDSTKSGLVEKIKSLQRSSDEEKQSWWEHCDTLLNGIRDPNRHDVDALQSYLASRGHC